MALPAASHGALTCTDGQWVLIDGTFCTQSDQLEAELAQRGVELTAPHRRDRKRETKDGTAASSVPPGLWKVERLFAWRQSATPHGNVTCRASESSPSH